MHVSLILFAVYSYCYIFVLYHYGPNPLLVKISASLKSYFSVSTTDKTATSGVKCGSTQTENNSALLQMRINLEFAEVIWLDRLGLHKAQPSDSFSCEKHYKIFNGHRSPVLHVTQKMA